ncbi:TIGR03943 family putative permease subunit [Paenibacillus wynnii]|uniref:TIGR03943 family putative permease subunit n=1 Tax=Paenibacillus wynnii TaxID=268407 RepID=UPI002792EBC1|nr:TIGR03943 family protein [Paenibacillus wynnii]MDQ0195696.1 putative repeat protein (TIGR03943 family) [Paenibacillus wynnii]
MNDSRSIRMHYTLRAFILLSFALYIGHLAQQDTLHYYVTPKLASLVKLCPIPLAAMAFSLTIQALFGKSSALCNCDQHLPRSGLRSITLYSLFLFPLLLGFLLPDRALGSVAASKKGVSLTYVASEQKFISSDSYQEEFAELARILYEQPVISVYPEIFSETFGAIDRYKQPFEGKEIIVSGFLYPNEPESHDKSFTLSRFLVQCCTADATPFGIMVDPGTQISLPADTWIEVRGKLHIVQYKGQEIMQISAVSITPISQPPTPYIYTSPDSVEAWYQLEKSSGGASEQASAK